MHLAFLHVLNMGIFWGGGGWSGVGGDNCVHDDLRHS